MASRTSRKKSKGKERKAKKEAGRVEAERKKVRDLWLDWAVGLEQLVGKRFECHHGYKKYIHSRGFSHDHPVSSFMDTIFSNLDEKIGTICIRDEYESHPQVWNDNRNKMIAINLMVKIGTSMLLSNKYVNQVRVDFG